MHREAADLGTRSIATSFCCLSTLPCLGNPFLCCLLAGKWTCFATTVLVLGQATLWGCSVEAPHIDVEADTCEMAPCCSLPNSFMQSKCEVAVNRLRREGRDQMLRRSVFQVTADPGEMSYECARCLWSPASAYNSPQDGCGCCRAAQQEAVAFSSKEAPTCILGRPFTLHNLACRVDMVLVGAEGVLESGGIINKLGTHHIAIAAKAQGIPFYVAAESYKVGLHSPCVAQQHSSLPCCLGTKLLLSAPRLHEHDGLPAMQDLCLEPHSYQFARGAGPLATRSAAFQFVAPFFCFAGTWANCTFATAVCSSVPAQSVRPASGAQGM